MISFHAYAKVNLTLEVLGKRPDGFHEIASVLQTIDLADIFSLEPAQTIQFVCRDPSAGRPDLLAEPILRAANLLREKTRCSKGALIRLGHVGIPRAAGLGSSSSGPASVLNGLNELWALDLSLDRLEAIAAELGSDTPFFIRGGTVLARGRGEHLAPLPSPSPAWLVILVPPVEPVQNKTARLYQSLKPVHFTSGAATEALASELRQGKPLPPESLYNTFEHVAFDFFTGLREYRAKFLAAGAQRVHLAGSGPALFALVSGESSGEAIARRLRGEGFQAYLAHTLSHSECHFDPGSCPG